MSATELCNRICHWGPIIALCMVNCITFSTLHVTGMWLPTFSSLGAMTCHFSFLFFVGSTLYNFFCAMFIGPGYIPFGWKPDKAEECCYLQYCELCKGYKAPRAHHCRKCERCVMKMDHHCPWINNCCGHKNHSKFALFLLSAVCGCLQTSVLLSIGLYKAFHVSWYFLHGDRKKMVYLTIYQLAFTVFSFGLALGVVIAVGGLFYIQMKQIIRNETSIENWIVTKAFGRHRPEGTTFVYPYDLGWWRNIKQVFWGPFCDGMTDWPLVEGCHPYTLTIEQLIQKDDKRARRRRYRVVRPYNGAWCPASQGLRTCLSPPCSDEPRLVLLPGDSVDVTRWRKRWLYGEKCAEAPDDAGMLKGWFPRCCALEFTSADGDRLSKKMS